MNLKKFKFDEAIKQSFLAGRPAFNGTVYSDSNEYGGLNPNGKADPRYFKDREKVWGRVDESIQQEIGNGKGSEYDSGKFFSVANSCRFAVASFTELMNERLEKVRAIGGTQILQGTLKFEKECRVDHIRGAAPQLDVYFQTENGTHYFFEVKCHELFDDHLLTSLSDQYKEKYFRDFVANNLIDASESQLLFQHWNKENGNSELCVKDFGVETDIIHFDFKQFICHLLGIISFRKKHPAEPIRFYYLFYYNPAYKNIYDKLEAEIKSVASAFIKVFEQYDIKFGYLYNDQFDTLSTLTPIWSTSN